jgi:NADPH2:quinone reductase
VLPAGQAVPLPESASFDLGAGLGIPALTAHRCLFADGSLDEHATVLVAAGAGAVGHAAIELAHRTGARVVATASTPEKAALATAAGAHAVVLYRREDAAQQLRSAAPDGVDRVVEIDLAANLRLDLDACRPHAAIATYADGDAPSLPLRPLMIANITLRFVLLYTLPAAALSAAVSEVSGALRERALTSLPITRFGLERIADAHDAVERRTVGKVLVDAP